MAHANPVNARVLQAEVMFPADGTLWLRDESGEIARVWAPLEVGDVVRAGSKLEVYLDAHDQINGWWHKASGLAVNLRGAAPGIGARFLAMVCQGTCGVIWQAPGAEYLAAHDDEVCLTCAGPLRAGTG
jgi:hypothetical protein